MTQWEKRFARLVEFHIDNSDFTNDVSPASIVAAWHLVNEARGFRSRTEAASAWRAACRVAQSHGISVDHMEELHNRYLSKV